ncbi:MAG: hypothetical protein ACK4PI_10420 [Tepidisphaerales bacterium]
MEARAVMGASEVNAVVLRRPVEREEKLEREHRGTGPLSGASRDVQVNKRIFL